MKNILSILALGVIILQSSYAQEPFREDGKWGVSEYGTAEDSIIVPAKYDGVDILFPSDYDIVYLVLENKEWKILSENRMISQQSYEEIVMPEFNERFLYCYRDGYLDIIDLKKNDFLIRAVEGEKIINAEDVLGDLKDVLMIENDGKFGLVDITTGKIILKAHYESVKGNSSFSKEIPIIAFDEDVNHVFQRNGEELFKYESKLPLTSVEAYDQCEKCYKLFSDDKKGGYGFYDSKNNWFVPTEFNAIYPIEETPEIVITEGKKGMGLYFKGEKFLDAEYEMVAKSDKRGYLAVVENKGEKLYLSPSGELVTSK